MKRLVTLAVAAVTAPTLAWTGLHLSSASVTTTASAPLPQVSPSATKALFTAEHHDLTTDVLDAVRIGGGVPLGNSSCPEDRLQLSFTDPGKGYRTGAFVLPLGPTPTSSTTSVNGVVLCRGSHDGYVGFDAFLLKDGWDVALVPDPSGGVDDETPGVNVPDKAPVPAKAKKQAQAAGGFTGKATGADIEGFAAYVGQTTCSPGAKAGTLALRNLLLARYPSTTSLGISRGCGVGGRSEHKEGRAFDWGATAGNAADEAAVHDLFSHLFATDAHGNADALVRRMGIMYVIWDHQIWSAYRAGQGWRPYSGANPHTDHVHISLSWAGALGQTSFWSGKVVEGLSAVPVGGGSDGVTAASAHTSTPTTTTHPTRPTGTSGTHHRHRPTAVPTARPTTGTRHRGDGSSRPSPRPTSWPTTRPTSWPTTPSLPVGSGSGRGGTSSDPVPAGSPSYGGRHWHH